MKNILFLLITSAIFFNSCTNDQNPAKAEFTSAGLKKLINDAVSGNENANDSLSGLINLSIPLPGSFNSLLLDSLSLASGKKYYAFLLEHANPVYNRFAVYDSDLKLHMIDKSLNGNLSFSRYDSLSNPFILIKENFISKDTLKIERISFFRVDDSSVVLSLRIFTRLALPKIEYTQTIDEISEERVKTSISSSKVTTVSNKGDVFVFDSNTKKYVSGQEIFYQFVIDEVNKYQHSPRKPEITDYRSSLLSVGIIPDIDTIKSTANTARGNGFSLTLNENWRELKDVSISSHVNRDIKGTRYLNNNTGASIYVISLVPEDSAEMYVSAELNRTAEGNYKVRFSDKAESGKNYIQYFEFSCGEKKYLMIFETSKYTYERFKKLYEDIINSFVMDC